MTKDQAEKNAIEEISNALFRQDSERQFIADVCARLKEEHESDVQELKKLGRIRFKQNLEEEKAKANAIFERYEELFEAE